MDARLSRYALTFCLVVFTVGVPLLFMPWNNYYESRSLKEIWNFGHVLLFACSTILLSAYWPWFRGRLFETQIVILVSLALTVGMGIEIIQLHTGGDFSLRDVCLDVTGACLVPALKPQCRASFTKYSLWMLRLVVFTYLLARAFPVGISLVDEYRAERDFPILAGFESSLELERFTGGNRLKLMQEGLQVSFGTEQYSGFSLKYFPADWTGYHVLKLDVLNPGKDGFYLTCRIHDQHHDQSYQDRYNRWFTIYPGKHTLEINLEDVRTAPLSREMDMKKIGGLGCFTVKLPVPRVVIIRKIVLG